MLRGDLRTGDVPASPSIFDRSAMIDLPPLRVVVLVVRQRQHAHRQHARHAVGLRQQVALQAVGIAADELRLRAARLRYRVEVNALGRVERRRLDRVCALRPRNSNRVVEIHRARGGLADVRALQAVLGEHQRLGRGRNVERLQHRCEIAARHRIERERDLTLLNRLVQPDDDIARRPRRVLDGRMIARYPHATALRQHRSDAERTDQRGDDE